MPLGPRHLRDLWDPRSVSETRIPKGCVTGTLHNELISVSSSTLTLNIVPTIICPSTLIVVTKSRSPVPVTNLFHSELSTYV